MINRGTSHLCNKYLFHNKIFLFPLLSNLLPGDGSEVNLVRAVSKPERSGPGVELSQGQVRVQPRPAVCLEAEWPLHSHL